MSEYPPPPWTLGGWGIATVGFVSIAAAAEFVPAGAQLVPILPGKTIGGLFFLSYERGSLVYHELNVVAGLIRVGLRFAFLLPRLYVDSPASLAGGREIWAVPKELAEFSLEHDASTTTVRVRQGGRDVCRIRCTTLGKGLRLSAPLPSLGVREESLLFFTGKLRAQTSAARAEVELPRDGEFTALGLAGAHIALRCDDVALTVPAPHAIVRHSKLSVPSG